MDWDVFNSLVGGGIISGLVGWFFARQGSRQLAKTHGQVVLLLRGLQEGGVIEYSWDEAGEATGFVICLSANSFGTSHASADLTVTPHRETPPHRKGVSESRWMPHQWRR